MPVTFPPSSDPFVPPPHRVRWTREQCTLMHDNGILIGRYELVDGEIVSKMGQNPPHSYVIRALMAWLVRVFGEEYVQVQLPIRIVGEDADYNDPEPDCAVLALPAKVFADHHPIPSELRLVIEVSDSTLGFDLNTKGLVYGRAGVSEYWVVDLSGRRLITFRDPISAGYDTILSFAESESCSTLASPEHSILIADLLPPRQG